MAKKKSFFPADGSEQGFQMNEDSHHVHNTIPFAAKTHKNTLV